MECAKSHPPRNRLVPLGPPEPAEPFLRFQPGDYPLRQFRARLEPVETLR